MTSGTISSPAGPALEQYPQTAEPPLVVDLDGTLIRSDALVEAVLALLRVRPFMLFMLPVWLLGGRARLKRELAALAPVDATALPYDEALLDWLRAEHGRGRVLVLATASDQAVADAVAAHLGLFAMVLGSDGVRNLKGENKAAALSALFPQGFDYAGDSPADLAVWRRAAGAVAVGVSPGLRARVAALAPIRAEFARPAPGLALWARTLRVHQWAKNGLVFLPMLLSHQYGSALAWLLCGLGFVALSLLASGTYILNDLLDLPNDRRHRSKRGRPIPAGLVGVREVLAVALGLLAVALGLGLALGPAPLAALLAYLLTTMAYSLWLKREPIIDVAVIAGLFTLRLAFGIVLVGAEFSPWLLAFASFLFFSLALAKRHTEVLALAEMGQARAGGRGYMARDAGITLALGTSTAVAAILVFILYLVLDALPNGPYRTPEALWGMPLLIGLWIGRIWLLADRGEMHDDPVAFAIRDRASIIHGCFMVVFFIWAVAL